MRLPKYRTARLAAAGSFCHSALKTFIRSWLPAMTATQESSIAMPWPASMQAKTIKHSSRCRWCSRRAQEHVSLRRRGNVYNYRDFKTSACSQSANREFPHACPSSEVMLW